MGGGASQQTNNATAAALNRARVQAEAQQAATAKAAEEARKAAAAKAALPKSEAEIRADKLSAGVEGPMGSDIKAGARFGSNVLGEEGLGRLGENEGISRTMGRLEDLSQGFSAEELSARRDSALSGINQGTQTASRQLQRAQSRSGLKGGAAGAQQRDVQLGGLQQKAQFERDLTIADRAARVEGVQNLGKAQGDIAQFDLSQQAAEKNILLQSGLGFAQIGSAERGAAAASAASVRAAQVQAPSCFPADTMIDTTEGKKAIQDLIPGDVLSNGNVVGITGMGVGTDFYMWRGITITAKHVVNESGRWLEVENSLEAIKLDMEVQPVYNIYCDNGEIEINGQTLADFSTPYSIGGIKGVCNNIEAKIWKRGLQFISELVGTMGLVPVPVRATSKDRNNNKPRR